MKVKLNRDKRVRIEMLPLIDVVFLVLVFFIYAMLSMAVHRGLPVALPTSSSAGIDKKEALSVTVKADGRIYVDKEEIALKDLGEALRRKVKEDAEPDILLFADHSLSYQKLFRVLDQIRMSGLNRISLQADVDR